MGSIGICLSSSSAYLAAMDWKSQLVHLLPAERNSQVVNTSLHILRHNGAAYIGQGALQVFPMIGAAAEDQFYKLSYVFRDRSEQANLGLAYQYVSLWGQFFRKLEADVSRHLLQNNAYPFAVAIPDVFFTRCEKILQKALISVGIEGSIIPYSKVVINHFDELTNKRALLIYLDEDEISGFLIDRKGLIDTIPVFDHEREGVMLELAKRMYRQVLDTEENDKGLQSYLGRKLQKSATNLLQQYLSGEDRKRILQEAEYIYDQAYLLQVSTAYLEKRIRQQQEQLLQVLEKTIEDHRIEEIFLIGEQLDISLSIEAVKEHFPNIRCTVLTPEELAKLAVTMPLELRSNPTKNRKASRLTRTIHLVDAHDKSILLTLKKGSNLPVGSKGVLSLLSRSEALVLELVEEVEEEKTLFGVINLKDLCLADTDSLEVHLKMLIDGKLHFDALSILTGKKQKFSSRIDNCVDSIQIATIQHVINSTVIVNNTDDLNISLFRF